MYRAYGRLLTGRILITNISMMDTNGTAQCRTGRPHFLINHCAFQRLSSAYTKLLASHLLQLPQNWRIPLWWLVRTYHSNHIAVVTYRICFLLDLPDLFSLQFYSKVFQRFLHLPRSRLALFLPPVLSRRASFARSAGKKRRRRECKAGEERIQRAVKKKAMIEM